MAFCMGQDMKSDFKTILLCVSILAWMSGCRRESTPIPLSEVAPEEIEIQNDIKLVSDWQSHFDLLYVRHHFLTGLSGKIRYSRGGAFRDKYYGKFLDAAFGIPVDASDVGTRTRQFDSFCRVTDVAVNGLADFGMKGCDDYRPYWNYALRRLEFVGNELKKVETYVGGKGEENTFSGSVNEWESYCKTARREYNFSVERLERDINNFLVISVLSHEQWTAFRLRLEKILGHKVPIREDMDELWKQKQKWDVEAKKRKDTGKSGRRGETER